MVATANSIAIGEAMYNHKIIMGTKESKAQWRNPAKDVDYDWTTPLDDDVTHTARSLQQAEEQLGQPMVIWEEAPKN
jgi:hypothetical protein